VIPAMRKQGPVVAWIVDDTGFPKGKHAVGVTRPYCGQVGKQENCRVAVSLSTTQRKALVKMAKHRWIIERDYQERKQELGTGALGRPPLAWVSPPRHAVHCSLWVAGRGAEPFFPSARVGNLGCMASCPAPGFLPRGSPHTPRAT